MKQRVITGLRAVSFALLFVPISTGFVLAQGVPPGNYECWYFTRAQPGLSFTVNGGGAYTDVDGKKGSIALGNDGGGAHDGSNAVYKAGNPPTISFVSAGGAEAAFCQLAR
jgi:hypothetical protein